MERQAKINHLIELREKAKLGGGIKELNLNMPKANILHVSVLKCYSTRVVLKNSTCL